MKKNLFILTVCLTLSSLASSQEYYKGVVVDSLFQPIVYATVSVQDYKIGCYSDENGIFFLNKENLSSDSLVIRGLGYKPKVIPLHVLENSDTIVLESDTVILPEVVLVRQKKQKYLALGPKKRKGTYIYSFKQKAEQHAIVIKGTKDLAGKVLEAIEMDMNISSFKSASPPRFRMRLYSFDEKNRVPAESLIDAPLDFIPTKERFELNVSDLRINFPSTGLVVAIEAAYEVPVADIKIKNSRPLYIYGPPIKLTILEDEQADDFVWLHYNPKTQSWIESPNKLLVKTSSAKFNLVPKIRVKVCCIE